MVVIIVGFLIIGLWIMNQKQDRQIVRIVLRMVVIKESLLAIERIEPSTFMKENAAEVL
jgi:hypothetical protein